MVLPNVDVTTNKDPLVSFSRLQRLSEPFATKGKAGPDILVRVPFTVAYDGKIIMFKSTHSKQS